MAFTGNDLWNGFYPLGGEPGSITDGVFSANDQSTSDGAKLLHNCRVKGGDKVELSFTARAISGAGAGFIDISQVGVLLSDVKVAGHDDWRRYTVCGVVPPEYDTVLVYFGVGVYNSTVGHIEFRLPSIKVNGTQILPGVVDYGLCYAPNRDLMLTVNDKMYGLFKRTDGAFCYQGGAVGSFPSDPIDSKENGISIGQGGGGRLKIYESGGTCTAYGRSSAGQLSSFYYVTAAGGNNTLVGSISITATSTAYNTSSDYRLKDAVQDLDGSGMFIDALRPRAWRWVQNGGRGVGFIAHELQEVSQASVTGDKDGLNVDGSPEYQSVFYGSPELIANMVAEIKSLRRRVSDLERK